MTEIPIEGFSPGGGGSLCLVPSMSDQFHRLAQGLAEISLQHPNDIAPPAGVVVIAAAALEAYVNELIEIAIPSDRQGEIRGLGTNLIGKLRWLRDNSALGGLKAKSAALTDEVLADAALLYGFRGSLMHYAPEPEHPVDTKTSMQRLLKRFPEGILRETEPSTDETFVAFSAASTARLLTPRLAEWAKDVLDATIKAIYATGWDVPRPLWLPLVDPTRD